MIELHSHRLLKVHFWLVGSNCMYLGSGWLKNDGSVEPPMPKTLDRNMRADCIQVTNDSGEMMGEFTLRGAGKVCAKKDVIDLGGFRS